MRCAPITLLAVALLAAPAAAGDAAGTQSRDLRRGMALASKADKALQAGSFSKARDFYQRALEAAPNLPQAHLGLGHVAMQDRRFEEALAEFERARDGYGHMGQALMEQHMERYYAAQDRLVELRELQRRVGGNVPPNDPAAQARVETRLAQISAEIDRLQNIDPPTEVEVSEAPGEVYFFIGNALSRLGRADDALAAWETCADRSPDHPFVHNNLAVAYWQAGRLEEAQSEVVKVEESGMSVNPQFKADLALSLERQNARAAGSEDEDR